MEKGLILGFAFIVALALFVLYYGNLLETQEQKIGKTLCEKKGLRYFEDADQKIDNKKVVLCYQLIEDQVIIKPYLTP